MNGDVTPEREALADWLGAQVESHNVTNYTDEATTWIEVAVDDLTDRLLASDWLAAHDAEVAARALREAADAWATGEWNDYFLADDVTDDESAVRSMDRFLRERAEAYRAGTGEGAGK